MRRVQPGPRLLHHAVSGRPLIIRIAASCFVAWFAHSVFKAGLTEAVYSVGVIVVCVGIVVSLGWLRLRHPRFFLALAALHFALISAAKLYLRATT